MVGLGWVEDDVRRSESCGDEKVWKRWKLEWRHCGGTSSSRTEDWRCLEVFGGSGGLDSRVSRRQLIGCGCAEGNGPAEYSLKISVT